jgi:hypothetical protein
MNPFRLTIIFISINLSALAQQKSVYQKDLDSLYNALQETPSYKEQMTGPKKIAYEQLYEKLKTQQIRKSNFDTLYQLSALLYPIRDNHLGLFETPRKGSAPAVLTDSASSGKLKPSSDFKYFPLPIRNVDSLSVVLKRKVLNDVEGIYFQGAFKIGIYFDAKADRYIGIILASSSPIWKKGEMVLLLYKVKTDLYRGVYANLSSKQLYFVKNEKFSAGRLLSFGSKMNSPQLMGHVNYKKPLLELRTIDSNIQYLRLGNFHTSDEELLAGQQFYNKIKDSLFAKNLIVDIRNNPGGGFKASGRFLSLLKRYSQDGKIYALINGRTVSNAEQFTLRLKSFNNVVTLGETTMGMITYGSNYGKNIILPSGRYTFYPTDMRDSGNYLEYEDEGIKPDIVLNQESDWIEQVVTRIRKGESSGL